MIKEISRDHPILDFFIVLFSFPYPQITYGISTTLQIILHQVFLNR